MANKKSMVYAWTIKTTSNKSMSESLKQGWKVLRLHNELKNGIVHFRFIKKDGSVREANGTTNLSLIPKESHPFSNKQTSKSVQVFFDVDKSEWRSFSIASLM